MNPTPGRIVHYVLREADAEAVNRRRTTGGAIAERMPIYAQAHITEWPFVGNLATAGDVLPMIIARVWPDEYGAGVPGVNGQVFLDGNDTLWVTSVREGTEPGTWCQPPRV